MILIAESKNMTSGQVEVGQKEFEEFSPLYDGVANAIMESLCGKNTEQISEEAGITARLAASLRRMIYEFPDKSHGIRAIDAFTGVVFRQLDTKSYDAAQTGFLQDNLRIISSLYGWLRPGDIIKPYRFDFKSRVAPQGETLMKYWKKDVTIALVKELQLRGDRGIIDLLPSDASKCIDWKLVKRFAKVYKVDFKAVVGSEGLRTPHSGRLKELRGCFLDEVIRRRLTSPDKISRLETSDFMPDTHSPTTAGCISFLTA